MVRVKLCFLNVMNGNVFFDWGTNGFLLFLVEERMDLYLLSCGRNEFVLFEF